MDSLIAHDHKFVDISAGDYAASISTFGGGPRSLEYAGAPLLSDYPKGFNPPLSAGTILAPWPNRVADGVFIFGGDVHRLDISEPSRANAIHGFVAGRVWEVGQNSPSSVSLSTHVAPQPGWPWALDLAVTWSVDAESGLSAEVAITNDSEAACPFGLGWHPYLSALGAAVDDCTLRLPVDKNLPLEPVRNLPAGTAIAADDVLPGVGSAAPLAGVWLDHCFFDSGARERGQVRRQAELLGPDGRGALLWADGSFGWFQVYTADPARREGFPGHGKAIAVEPMTCPPDALRSGTGLLVLSPGERKVLQMGVRAVAG
nr:aldose 1-epimerase family protein [Corynebacterium lactis]